MIEVVEKSIERVVDLEEMLKTLHTSGRDDVMCDFQRRFLLIRVYQDWPRITDCSPLVTSDKWFGWLIGLCFVVLICRIES